MLSVIVPVYNAEKYLKACVESVLAQAFTDLEVILIDDGSKDNSLVLARELAASDSRVRVFTQVNAGPSAARNAGIERSRGAYIAFVDSDDTLEPDMYSRMTASMENAGLSFVLCGYSKIYEGHGKRVSEAVGFRDAAWNSMDAFMRDFGGLYASVLIQSPCNKLYSARLIRGNDVRFPGGISFGEDLTFNLRYLARCESVGFLDFAPYNYMIRGGGSLSLTVREDAFALKSALWEAVYDFARERPHYGVNGPILLKEFFKMAGECLEGFALAGNLPSRRRYELCREVVDGLLGRGVLDQISYTSRQDRILRCLYKRRMVRTVILYFRVKVFLHEHCAWLYSKLR
jgi:glycosyltransferase involved in cell wall biosynthesis